jgi:hypothetical protein
MLIDHAILPGMNGRFAPQAASRAFETAQMGGYRRIVEHHRHHR